MFFPTMQFLQVSISTPASVVEGGQSVVEGGQSVVEGGQSVVDCQTTEETETTNALFTGGLKMLGNLTCRL